ncbi:MAG: 23S rRNA (uracil(1939)-C(5))-methyltransferase RlmD [Planctomycetota bacterium]|nr:23S rRNA (uracil(1939)-C(5))-methyltransferase RlmD [Planctomycetota bacterium]
MPRRSRQPDPAEQTFDCRHFGVCGGCSLLDQPVAWQLHDKVAQCEAMLAPFLGELRVAHELPRRPQRWFRSRLLYPVKQDRERQPVLGIFEYRSHHVVPIAECQTQDLWLTELGKRVEGILRELRLEGFQPSRRRGVAKAFWARLASGTGEVLAGLVTRPGPFPDGPRFADLLEAAARELPQRGRPRRLVGVIHSISDREDQFLLGDRHVPLRGRDHVVDERDGLRFRVSAGSFYQIHSGAYELLYAPAIAMCGDVHGKRVVDGYGGIGAFGLRLARAGAADVLVVEDNAAACRDAEANAKDNGLAQVRVQRTSFPKADLPEDVDVMVVDPPRSGLQQAGVDAVLRSRPRRLVYVACAAEALARDLQPLTASGYALTDARLCDLFPHTEHVELVACLERR